MLSYEQLMALKAERKARHEAEAAIQAHEVAIEKVTEQAQEMIAEEAIEEEKVEVKKVQKKGGKNKKGNPTRSFMTVDEGENVFVAPEALSEADADAQEDED